MTVEGSATGRISHSFASVDGTSDVGSVVAYLDAQAATPFWRALKRESIAALQLHRGDVAADVGCGTGSDVRAMAAVDGVAEAIGVDPSSGLLEVARARAAAAPSETEQAVRFVAGRAEDLPLPDASVDALRCERTLQHVGDVDAAIESFARVLRPGGAIALVEPDWETLVFDVDPAPVSRLVGALWVGRIPQPIVGRTLARRLHAAGFRGVTVRARTTVITAFAYADQQFDLARIVAAGAESGALDRDAAASWLADARERDAHGRFLASATYFLATGRRGPSGA